MTVLPARAAPGGALIAFVVTIKLLTWLLAGERYGFMSDELYFLDAGRHLALGYVDFPPLIAWLAAGLQGLGLASVAALRGVTTLAGIAVTLLSVDLCRRLGGRAFAQWVTALILLFAPGLVSVQGLFTMNALDQLWWALSFWLALRYLQERRPGFMVALGAVLGLGVLTKLSILALCAALPIAALIWDRSVLLRREAWLAMLLALAVASPYLFWQVNYDWPFLEFISAYNSHAPTAMVLENPLLGILLTMSPLFAVVWGPGAVYALIAPMPALRLLGTTAWLCLALFVAAGVKFYFAVPLFLLFTAAGAIWWEGRLSATRLGRAALLASLATGALALPMAAPLLPAPLLQRVADFLRDGEQGGRGTGPAELERYFPHFAEMHGWPELVSLTASHWQALSPAQRDGAVIVASHYGQAAALNLLDESGRLPTVHGRHMTYALWSRDVLFDHGLFVGFPASELKELFAEVQELARLQCQPCMRREQNLSIHYVAQPRVPQDVLHERLRRYDFF